MTTKQTKRTTAAATKPSVGSETHGDGSSASASPRTSARAWRRAGTLGLALLGGATWFGAAAPAFAQQTTGRIVGRVVDRGTGKPISGVTVVAHGAQGDEGVVTDDAGEYALDALPVGTYVIRYYVAGSSSQTERPNVVVSADKTVRANAALAGAEAPVETVVIRQRPPAVDVGSPRTGLTLDERLVRNVPLGRTFGDALLLAPGTFVERSGNVSIGGATGLENVFYVDGLNVTGIEYGDLMSGRSDASGGTNLVLDFVKEINVDTGGYAAEHGGAMGGVVNVVTKSGSNEFHGSVFSLYEPSVLAGNPRQIGAEGSTLVGRDRPGHDLNLGAEIGGPILRDRLFFWMGFAPRFQSNDFQRDVRGLVDADGDGQADLGPSGDPLTTRLARTSIDQHRRTYNYGAKLTFVPATDHRLNLSLFGTPTSTQHVGGRSSGNPALGDPRWALQKVDKNNTDLLAHWTSHLFDRRWRLEAAVGLHHESYDERSPYADLNRRNQIEWIGASLADLEAVPGCERQGAFDPCPVPLYRGGGYGLLKSYTGQRWTGDLKSTHRLELFGRHELKYGVHVELDRLEQTRTWSGADGQRAWVQNSPGNTSVATFFTLPRGRYPFQFTDFAPGDFDPNGDGSPEELTKPGAYKDALSATVKNVKTAYFLQDSYAPLPNLTLNLGARLEVQRLYDAAGTRFLKLSNLGLRGGFVFDPTREGRGRVYGHYGRFFEAIPLNLVARYFGGEGLLVRNHDNTSCAQDPSGWRGDGEWSGCPLQPQTAQSGPYSIYNNGSNYPVQPKLRAQHHDEIIAGVQHEVGGGLVLGAEVTRRWLGTVIEDGTATDGTFVLANPGRVPKSALAEVERQIAAKQRELDAAEGAAIGARQAELGALRSKLDNLRGLAALPKPERTYTALTVSASQRFSRAFSAHASYTFSRLIGNYNGLYDADNDYLAPNGGNAFDTPDLVLNKRGPLANDRPHSARVAGFWERPLGSGSLTTGLFFSAFSGVPRNHQAALLPGQQLVFLLPRGSAGRTPAVTQLDLKLAYRRPLSALYALELFVDVFNVLNSRTALRLDDDYTYDQAAAIVNGSVADLRHAKNAGGQPVAVNSNFGNATAYQAPVHGRLGLRLTF